MKRFIISLTAILAVSSPAFGQSEALYEAIETAQSLADEKQFGRALIILNDVNSSEKQEYDYRFMRARLLVWSGDYVRASDEFDSLMVEYPNNPDLMVSFAYLEFFRGNLRSAEIYFNKVLDVHPAYIDAYDGLQRTYELRNSTREISYSALAEAVSCEEEEVLQRTGACTAG